MEYHKIGLVDGVLTVVKGEVIEISFDTLEKMKQDIECRLTSLDDGERVANERLAAVTAELEAIRKTREIIAEQQAELDAKVKLLTNEYVAAGLPVPETFQESRSDIGTGSLLR